VSIQKTVLLSLCILLESVQAAPRNDSLLICEFERGVGLNLSTGEFSPKAETRRFSFRLPISWQMPSNASYTAATIIWTNMIQGWGGNATGILNGRMVSIVETTISDNSFLAHIWLDRLDRLDRTEAVFVVAGHSDLPKDYGASSLFVGRCSKSAL